jgi:hypothetical protein
MYVYKYIYYSMIYLYVFVCMCSYVFTCVIILRITHDDYELNNNLSNHFCSIV